MKIFKKLFIGFFGFILLYHIIQTVIVFGLELTGTFSFALLKDGLWVLIVGAFIIWGWKRFFKGERSYSILYSVFFLLLLWTGLHTYQVGINRKSAIVGFKYDIRPIVVVVSAVVCGWILRSITIPKDKVVTRIILWVLLGGILRQGLKYFFPEIFMQLGYGTIGDYLLGGSPPLWYRTGPGGMMRLQGIFSGPNNYGYLLVAFFGIIGLYVYKSWNSGKQGLASIIAIVYTTSLLFTISRGAVIGVMVQIGLLGFLFFRKQRKHIIGLLIVGIIGLVGFSLTGIKQSSTISHFEARGEGIQAFIDKPLGYGLGSAGPSVHFDGVYLPENQYLQIGLDLGWLGLLLWMTIRIVLIYEAVYIIKNLPHGSSQKIIITCLLTGLIGLLVEGLFLHSFEDSMINYLFLGIFGLLIGSYQYQLQEQ